VIGPGGVFVIDSKQYRGRLQLDPSGRLWHGRHPLAYTLQAVSFEADQAAQVLPDPGVAVVPIVAGHGAQVPWGKVVMNGVPVVAAAAPAKHASRPPGGVRARAGGIPYRSGADWLPRRRLIAGTSGLTGCCSCDRECRVRDAIYQRRPAHCCPLTTNVGGRAAR
jgi:hypothetical protein